ncbi:MAG: endonuclease V [Candidatus Nealsonbacteria bacterium]|nr:endonuclease V [Candidatus Nealsonbacteria bacterium]
MTSLGEIPDLSRCLRDLIAQVPAGRVTTYGRLAEALGNRIAARWVGHFAMNHAHTPTCPCHRIVRADGRLGLFIAGDERAKARRLAREGVIAEQGAVDLTRYGFDDFVGNRPLQRLERIQQDLVAKVSIRPRRRMPKLAGGVDVSYPNPDEGVAAYALVETATGRLVWSTTVRRRVVFPYITTYLAFRELPVLLDLIEAVRVADRLAPVVLVDGSGILHQRHAGVASHLGVVAGIATVGVTKKLLCGQVDIDGMASGESRPVVHEDRLIGTAIRPTAGSRRPIFISPGHRVDVAFSERLVQSLLHGRRLPEPIYWADRLSRAV